MKKYAVPKVPGINEESFYVYVKRVRSGKYDIYEEPELLTYLGTAWKHKDKNRWAIESRWHDWHGNAPLFIHKTLKDAVTYGLL